MERLGVDLLVASSPTNVAYLTGFDCYPYRAFKEFFVAPGGGNRPLRSFALFREGARPGLVASVGSASFTLGLDVDFIPHGDSPTVLTDEKVNFGRNEATDILKIHRGKGNPRSPVEALVDAVKRSALEKGKIGLEYDTLDRDTISLIKKKLPDSKIGDCTEVLRLIRMVKTGKELEKMRGAVETNERALLACVEKMRVGTSWGEVRRAYLKAIGETGDYPEHYIYAVNGFDPTDYDRAIVRRGDVGFIDIGVLHDLYVSDTGASFFVGANNGEALGIFKKLRSQLEEASDSLSPGAGALDILAVMGRHAKRNGIKFLQHGHGLGMEPREHPVIMTPRRKSISDDLVEIDSNIPLEESMIVNLETPYYKMGVGSFNIEETFVITKGGRRRLAKQRRDEPFMV